MYFSPFEQFEVTLLRRITIGNVDLSVTNITIFFALVLGFLSFFFLSLRKEIAYVPKPWQNFAEIFYLFIYSLVVEQGGERGRFMFPPLFTLFFLIFTFNLLGLLPFSLTLSAHIVITFSLSFSFFVAWIIKGLVNLRMKFFGIFLPKGIPLWLAPLLVLVEILSFFLRPLSLAIRLFANMLAGHILIHIVAASVIFLINKFFLLFFFPFIVVIFIYVLEIGICFLQAYIFTILLCIYLHDSLYIH